MDARIAKCLLLTKVLAADGIMTENERTFLDGAMTRFGISDRERRNVLDLVGWDDAESALAELSMDDKRELVGQLVDAASADGRLSPLEMAMVKRISAALGVEA